MPDGVTEDTLAACSPILANDWMVELANAAIYQQPSAKASEDDEAHQLSEEFANVRFAQGYHSEGPDHRDHHQRPEQPRRSIDNHMLPTSCSGGVVSYYLVENPLVGQACTGKARMQRQAQARFLDGHGLEVPKQGKLQAHGIGANGLAPVPQAVEPRIV